MLVCVCESVRVSKSVRVCVRMLSFVRAFERDCERK